MAAGQNLPGKDGVPGVSPVEAAGNDPSGRGELRLGVIGLGLRSALTRFAHRPKDGVRVVAGADPRHDAQAQFRNQYGAGTFTTDDPEELAARPDVDAVFVTSPDFLHEAHAVAALRARKPVYLEKPMATTIEGCDRILQTAYDTKTKLYVGHNMRHMAFVLKMRELIDQGAIGEVKTAWCRHFIAYGGDAYFKDWHAEREKTTGLLLQKAAHDIDVLHWLCGGHTIRVNAMGGLTVYDRVEDRHPPSAYGDATWKTENWPPLAQTGLNPVIDVEDVSMMQMRLSNGIYAAYQQCHFTPDAWRNYTIIGTEGRIENFGDFTRDCTVRLWNRRTDYNPHGDAQFHVPQDPEDHGGADPRIVAEFIRYVRRGGKIRTSPVAARNSVAAACLATRSLRSDGNAYDVPSVPEKVAAYFDADVEA